MISRYLKKIANKMLFFVNYYCHLYKSVYIKVIRRRKTMTTYQKIKKIAQAKGIDTRKDAYNGYWLTDKNGNDLYADDNFCSSLSELKSAVEAH
jgi:effector-binding domain-containing protein